jgi:hypothetical protein
MDDFHIFPYDMVSGQSWYDQNSLRTIMLNGDSSLFQTIIVY